MTKKQTTNYIFHFCRNPKCNNGWMDLDVTHVKKYPPKWKYCKECCKELGIDFDKQKPSDYHSEARLEALKKLKNSKDE